MRCICFRFSQVQISQSLHTTASASALKKGLVYPSLRAASKNLDVSILLFRHAPPDQKSELPRLRNNARFDPFPSGAFERAIPPFPMQFLLLLNRSDGGHFEDEGLGAVVSD